MFDKSMTLGLDVGAIAIKAAWETGDGKVHRAYRPHRGRPDETIAEILEEIGSPRAVAVTGTGGPRISERLGIPYVDSAVALTAATRADEGIRHIVDIGGGSLSIVDIDTEGRFAGFRTNSLCAAGTGSFLDEQAARMKLTQEEMAAERNNDDPPRIAARCAVFAKSDLIHRQQEGYSIPDMWSGLCQGMVSTALNTLFRGRKPQGKVLIAGGVAKNKEVLRWLRKEIGVGIVVPEGPETFSATGALKAARPVGEDVDFASLKSRTEEAKATRRTRLEFVKSSYPSFGCRESYEDDGTEVRLHHDLGGEVVMGIDIGSTSTKAAILDRDEEVIADFYRRTAGDPIAATQKIIRAIDKARRGADLTILGVGTTGSGRKMVGMIVGADQIINEITAHVRGAAKDTPDVETIFEIGGQDAKFVSIREGVPHDSNMNYVCAAGTGSFVEEQASKLGFKLTEIGDAVMGTEPPYSSDRCTVFMEQDVHSLTRQGFEREEIMGSVLYSVVQNYLNKVVGRRSYSKKKICFMGATARNKGLVAAFEQLIGCPVVVSPYCHVMGAYGVARTVLHETVAKGKSTTFVGMGFADMKVKLAREECKLCANACRITKALVGDNADLATAPSWGYMCGRDPEEARVRVNENFESFRRRAKLFATAGMKKDAPKAAKTVGIPMSLLTMSYLPLWRKFFSELGMKVVLSKPTSDRTLEIAAEWIGSDYCYPVKLAHGHLRELALNENVDALFVPYVVQGEVHDDKFSRSVFCPYNIAFASIAEAAGITESGSKAMIRPIVNLQWSKNLIVDSLARELTPVLGITRKGIARAWESARASQKEFSEKVEDIGLDELGKLEESGGQGIVVLGRPYNVYDQGANLGLPQKIADLGLTVLSVDMLPIRNVGVDPLFNNMYWRYGRRILQAAHYIAKHPKLHAVFLTNFGCGPDSFLQTYVEHIMKGKPMLLLELDEHSADAGYITRLEAFRDVIAGEEKPAEVKAKIEVESTIHESRITNHDTRVPETTWIPPMHPYGTSLMAGAFRGLGINAQPLPGETVESFALAKEYCRGTECVPAPATIGAFLHVLKKSDAPERQKLFMPSAKGPCRFGQYHTLHRMILDQAGFKESKVESWDDESGTYGTDRKTSTMLFNAIMASDLLFKMRCRIRPYACDRDAFDETMADELSRLIEIAESGKTLRDGLADAARRLATIKRRDVKKPLVGIVGEIYVRLNPFTNGRLVETIEEAGGEAWVAPLVEWIHYLSHMDAFFAREERKGMMARLKAGLTESYMNRMGARLISATSAIVGDRAEPPIASTLAAGEPYLPKKFEGESILTVGRAVEFAQQGVDLIINCAPFGCMPGTLTAGIFQKIEGDLKVPIMSLFFDGETDLRHLVRTYLSNLGATPYTGGVR